MFCVRNVRSLRNKVCPQWAMKRRLYSCDEPKPNPNRKNFTLDKPDAPMKMAEEFNSMWENPDCCFESCENFRHDIKYLKKNPNRIYTRTWNECEDFVKDKYVCIGEVLPAEVEIRPRRVETRKGAKLPCVGQEFKLDLMTCIPPPKLELPCYRISLPGCVPTKPRPCIITKKIECCQKRCTLYPSYSECKKPKPKMLPPTECRCLKFPSTCEVYAMFRKYALK